MSFPNFPMLNSWNMIQIMVSSYSNHEHSFWKWIQCWKRDWNQGSTWSESPDFNHDSNYNSNIFKLCYLIRIFSSLDLSHILCILLESNNHFSLFLCSISNKYINLCFLIFLKELLTTYVVHYSHIQFLEWNFYFVWAF